MDPSTHRVLFSLLSFIFAPFIVLMVIVIILASIGKSIGVRKLYISVLLKLFEWGKQKIDKFERKKSLTTEDSEDVFEAADHFPDDAPNGELDQRLIQREISLSSKGIKMSRKFSIVDVNRKFELSDVIYFARSGIEAIIEDEVTQRFSAADLPSWNLLTRTHQHYQFISYRLTFLWFAGWVLRYVILLPFRFFLAVFAVGSLFVGTAIIGQMPNSRMKEWTYERLSLTCYRTMTKAFSGIVTFHNRSKSRLYEWVSLTSYRIFTRSFSGVITFHNKQNKAKGGGICVANHTSPIDIIILGTDNCYAMVGQKQGGFMGIMQRAMDRASSNVWFERSEAKDRNAVARRLREHVEDTSKLPILIFPEGTCINNTSIMMFKKGSFEVGGMVYPVAIKYDSRFADPFWNSSKQGLMGHLFMILTSWALVCDVWYLPPQKILPKENSVQFANRVKAEIAEQGGLVDLEWDGQLKRGTPKESMKAKQQAEYSKHIKTE